MRRYASALLRYASDALRRESVRLFQVAMYSAYVGAGVHMAIVGAVPNVVSQALGYWAHFGWVGLLIGCPLLTVAGMWVERCRSVVTGVRMQIGGDLGVACAGGAYVHALTSASFSAGRSTLAMWVVLALSGCSLIMVARSIQKLCSASAALRAIDEDGPDA